MSDVTDEMVGAACRAYDGFHHPGIARGDVDFHSSAMRAALTAALARKPVGDAQGDDEFRTVLDSAGLAALEAPAREEEIANIIWSNTCCAAMCPHPDEPCQCQSVSRECARAILALARKPVGLSKYSNAEIFAEFERRVEKTCPYCEGFGVVPSGECKECNGSGFAPNNITEPVGVEEVAQAIKDAKINGQRQHFTDEYALAMARAVLALWAPEHITIRASEVQK